MNRTEIAERLGLPDSTHANNIVSRALRQHCAGGAELLDAKESLASIANNARNAIDDPRRERYRDEHRARREVAELALAKMLTIEAALIAALERAKDLPSGSLAQYQRGDRPS